MLFLDIIIITNLHAVRRCAS